MLIAEAKQAFQNVVTTQKLPSNWMTMTRLLMTQDAVSTAQTTLTNRLAAINSATTHDDVDAL